MAQIREVLEGAQCQGEDEIVVYTLDVSGNGNTPTSIGVEVKDLLNNYANVKDTVMPSGSPTANGNVISLPPLKSLSVGGQYRIEVKYTLDNGNTLEDFFRVIGER